VTKLRFGLIALIFGALSLVLSSCHPDQWYIRHGWWHLTSTECADATAGTYFPPSPYYVQIKGTTGYFSADSQGCHSFARNSGTVRVSVELIHANNGLCWGGVGWVNNPQGQYAAESVSYPPYMCGDGNYVAGAHNWVSTFNSGVITNFFVSDGDHYP
jgi:hypothetical protein